MGMTSFGAAVTAVAIAAVAGCAPPDFHHYGIVRTPFGDAAIVCGGESGAPCGRATDVVFLCSRSVIANWLMASELSVSDKSVFTLALTWPLETACEFGFSEVGIWQEPLRRSPPSSPSASFQLPTA
jgi:hypothetical protein